MIIGIIAIVIVVVVSGVLGLAATKPDSINVQRFADIHAPPERIFALINDFRN